MAPHALTDLNDVSGYYPSTANKASSKIQTDRNNLKAPLTKPALSTKIPFANLGFGNESPKNVWRLSADEIDEIEKNVRYFISSDLPLSAISATTFPLTSALRSKLRGILECVYGEEQFFILSGLDPYRYSDYQNVIIHAGLSSHVGSKRGMGGRTGGNNAVIQHITAMPVDDHAPADRYHGPPSRNQAIPFHTDNGDIISLFTLSRSKSGGSFYLADSTAVYNDLKASQPELAQTLCRDWTMINPSPSSPPDIRPLAFPTHHPTRVLINCSRARITGTPTSPRPSSLPPLTTLQRRALDALHYTAAEHAVKIDLEDGDVVFFNNLGMMHARDGFVDGEDEEGMGGSRKKKRHLLRLILRDEGFAWGLPGGLEGVWGDLYGGGVGEEVWPVERELFAWACSH